ncbi:poly [ADP-ribose] polymerase [Sporothrix brasiliensis 5110]|uniref:Poly [ADP-ribose] polymerase n=1 Tax=Sporothrix brasiliensis 5110 TaxID=1398154 RepID=A0A0C2FP19_9PEZI|nr:poly [ADP-ribose] polymerase [Sporothrix brasiliensis 5110]KIH92788.1 poly [ADP-ribose] polymerase [Sporothrix brasiliensis 5110]
MPPRKKPVQPLAGCKIALCGTFPKVNQAVLKKHIEGLGATPLDSVTPDATQLIASPTNFNKPTAKVTAAKKLDIPIVGVQWLLDCVSSNAMKDEMPYLLAAPPVAAPPSPPAPAAKGKKRAAPAAAAANGTNGTNGANAAAAAPPDAKRQKTDTKQDTKKDVKADTKAAPVLSVPVDEFCSMPNVAVHIDDDRLVWDASLNQTNSGNNNNKFYRIQLLRTTAGKFYTWTRWGRVGESGQSAMLGGGSMDDALKNFNKKFRDKSGLAWERRSDDPRPGKYAYVERNYEPDSDDESGDEPDDGGVKGEEDEEVKIADCTLARPVERLMELIFNRQFFAATMSDLNYDANKLPLGKLSKTTITRGFQALKNLSALLDDQSLAATEYHMTYPNAVESLSNLYYSVIPHDFGRHRPPVVADNTRLKKEIELLESLSDMKDAELLMKVDKARSSEDRSIHPTDKQYNNLGMEEVTPLDRNSSEFVELANYLNSTTGQTHNVLYEIEDIFRIERKGEKARFEACHVSSPAAKDADTRLLWHGSRVTNFGGILGQGLRIAPPEAPVSGYMFGKGIYLADMSSKSAGYCASFISKGTGLLLLCEAKLGDPLQKLTQASYTAGEDAKASGLFATLGQGRTAPPAWKDASAVHKDLAGVQMPDVSSPPTDTNVPNAGLYYNEYIVYDVNQIRLRYLFRVKMGGY